MGRVKTDAIVVECARGSYRDGAVGYAYSGSSCRMVIRWYFPAIDGSRYIMDVSGVSSLLT